MPNQKQGFNQLKNNLKDFAVIENSIENLRESEVHVTIPKFKIEAEYELKEHLSKLGMKDVFTSAVDLSGINGKKDLEVSKVIHKVVVEVNEEGSEVAAATAIINKTKGLFLLRKVHEFKANHPFIIFIRDNRTGMILLIGLINEL